jgi:uncharacterized protein (DUF433 family)
VTTTELEDTRFVVPLYTVPEAARYLGVPPTTFATWVKGYRRKPKGRQVVGKPIVTALPGDGRRASTVPFIGLSEGLTLAAFRRAKVPLQRIRPALEVLKHEIGLEHALASKKLYTDGVEILYDYAEKTGDHNVRELVVVRDNQRVFTEVVEDYLQRVDFGSDGYAALIRLPQYRTADVVADPRRGFGQPIFSRGGARLEDVLGSFRARQSLADLEQEYGLPRADLEDAVRVATLAA